MRWWAAAITRCACAFNPDDALVLVDRCGTITGLGAEVAGGDAVEEHPAVFGVDGGDLGVDVGDTAEQVVATLHKPGIPALRLDLVVDGAEFTRQAGAFVAELVEVVDDVDEVAGRHSGITFEEMFGGFIDRSG